MTSKELNLILLKYLPELKDIYVEETFWQDNDDTGSHIVYGDVLVPYLKKTITNKNDTMLKKIFVFIENQC